MLTWVIEDREWIDGELVSRNFFVIRTQTNDIYYFGEDVDFDEEGEIVAHDGAWRAGVDEATAGNLMPGTLLAGSRFYQESAPDIAEDRAEFTGYVNMALGDLLYQGVAVMHETSSLDSPCAFSDFYYAAGIGMIKGGDERELIEAGFIFRLPPHLPFKNAPR